jgi:hypothetical protein
MAHRTALLASIGLTLLLALGIFSARARLFEPTTTDATVISTSATVVDTSANAMLSGGLPPAIEAEQSIDEPDDEYEADEARSLSRGEPRDDDEGHEDIDEREDDEDDDD